MVGVVASVLELRKVRCFWFKLFTFGLVFQNISDLCLKCIIVLTLISTLTLMCFRKFQGCNGMGVGLTRGMGAGDGGGGVVQG